MSEKRNDLIVFENEPAPFMQCLKCGRYFALRFESVEELTEIVYEPDTRLRDNENVPLKEDIQSYFEREVLPHVSNASIDHDKTVRGYEISFTKYFYKYEPLRSLEEIKADILALEAETEGSLHKIIDL